MVDEAEDVLADGVRRVCLVHSDFNPKNLLVDPETARITGLIDWEFAHAGSPYADLGNLLRFSRGPGARPGRCWTSSGRMDLGDRLVERRPGGRSLGAARPRGAGRASTTGGGRRAPADHPDGGHGRRSPEAGRLSASYIEISGTSGDLGGRPVGTGCPRLCCLRQDRYSVRCAMGPRDLGRSRLVLAAVGGESVLFRQSSGLMRSNGPCAPARHHQPTEQPTT